MRSVQVNALVGPDGVDVVDVEDAKASEDEVLIEVHAVGISYPDVLLSRNAYQLKPDLPFQLGMDFAGVVLERPDSSGFQVGQRVAGFLPYGAGAELVSATPDRVLPLPDRLTFVQGAALPLNYLTAYFALVTRANLQPGEIVLVHGAAGGVGTATLQVAKGLGARTFAVVSTSEKAKVARTAGADEVLFVADFLAKSQALTGGAGVDVVLDVVGGSLMTDSLRALAPMGRLMVVGFVGGEIPQVKVNRLLHQNVDVRGVSWGGYTMTRPGLMRAQWDALMPLMREGLLEPLIGATYELADVRKALADVEGRVATGKNVLTLR